MKQNVKMNLLGASSYSLENEKKEIVEGAYLLAFDFPEHPIPGKKGGISMKVPCPFSLVPTLVHSDFPGQFECEAELRSAAGGKMSLFVLGVKRVGNVESL
ncbi:MAG: hypothetical protein H7833_08510 [Magnetococcus sp. DMHC-1]